MTLWKAISAVVLLAASTNANNADSNSKITTVAVLEFGRGGTVRKTTSTSNHFTAPSSINAFWANLHDMDPHEKTSKTTQPPGMTMIPDFFHKANGGLIVSLTGLDEDNLNSMNTLNSVLDATSTNVIGQFHLSGSKAKFLLPNAENNHDSKVFEKELKNSVKHVVSSAKDENKVKTISLHVDHDADSASAAAFADKSISEMFHTLEKHAKDTDSTFVIHLVIEEEEERATRRLSTLTNDKSAGDTYFETKISEKEMKTHRRLEESNDGGSLYYGFGYYDKNGEYYTPYRTIYEIQLYQVVLWSAIGLFVIVFVALNKMIGMPLMPDTLLFGESGKFTEE